MSTVKSDEELQTELQRMAVKAATLDSLVKIMGLQGLLPSHFADVKAFHQKFGLMHAEQPRHLTRRKLKERVEFLLEELTEFATASGLFITHLQCEDGEYETHVDDNGEDDQDLPAQADALVDLVYVALGTAVMMGLPWQELWDDVQRANLAKVRGPTKRGHAVDVTKPEGWLGPIGAQILADHGYDRLDYTNTTLANGDKTIDEAKCHDDL